MSIKNKRKKCLKRNCPLTKGPLKQKEKVWVNVKYKDSAPLIIKFKTFKCDSIQTVKFEIIPQNLKTGLHNVKNVSKSACTNNNKLYDNSEDWIWIRWKNSTKIRSQKWSWTIDKHKIFDQLIDSIKFNIYKNKTVPSSERVILFTCAHLLLQ